MKTLLSILFILGNIAFADTMLNQQYVSSGANNPQSMPAPASNNNQNYSQPDQDSSQYQQNTQPSPQSSTNPTQIYAPPAQNQPYNQQPDNQQTYNQQPYNQQPYTTQPAYGQQPYTSQPQQYQPQYSQPSTTQSSQWQTRPQDMPNQADQPMQAQNAPQYQPQVQQPMAAYQQAPPPPSYYPAQSRPLYNQPYPQQPVQNYQQPAPNNYSSYNSNPATAQAYPQTSMPPSPSAINPGNAYDAEEQQAWFNNCLKAVTSKEMTPYANAFCQCGWQKITGGGFNLSLLTSQNPADTQKANMILQGISQQCLLQVMQQAQQ